MKSCPDCTALTSCRWFCPVHLEHHPVANMVTHCVEIERATAPDAPPTA